MISTLRRAGTRHASAVAIAVIALSIAGTAAALVASRLIEETEYLGPADMIYVACQILPYGLVGGVLVARRPDLPFGWLLSLSAVGLTVMLAVGGASIAALEHGHGGQLAVWGLTTGGLMFVPAAIEGLVNVRFPSGRPSGRVGVILERALVVGIMVGLLGAVLGDSTVRAVYPNGPPGGAERFVDGSGVIPIGNAVEIAIPLVILLGACAGIGVIIRYLRSEGVERLQLKWRAAGVVGALLLFPFAVTETLPDVAFDLAPLLFVATLVVPVLRYDLWAIESIIRRSAVRTFASPATVVENMVRATADMLHLPHVAVRCGDRVLASYGAPADHIERWPLVQGGETVGELVVSPRHGFDAVGDEDRQVLTTLAEMLGGSVRAEALTSDLLQTRHRLVAAREEERRRLRRDLHDGLGPLLTGLGLNLDAAASQLGRSEAKAATYLGNAKTASTQVITSLRELVEGLRPPALDELGLAGALKLHLEPLATDAGLALDLRVPEQLSLPAAVEVATFRTAVEAVTNVVRHGRATKVCVEIVEHDQQLAVTITDDGPPGAAWTPGTGLAGMRERADELGGTFTAGPTSAGGLVQSTYPTPAQP